MKRITAVVLSLSLLLSGCDGTLERDKVIKRLNEMIEILIDEKENLQTAFDAQEDINFKLEKEKKEAEAKARNCSRQLVACRESFKKLENTIEESKE
ncbi:MAG: hypothetical protein LBM93_00160 [Oscillospiraceae bacterium]|jgi:septal ring factor EnvC (AmiA/AmiB activator)|nr:hypothetical protein [Oscillospiraceae bacterium]